MRLEKRKFESSYHDALLELLESNTDYYNHMKECIDHKGMLRMLTALPPGAAPKDKSNWIFLEEGHLVGFCELVERYPDTDTAMIGLLIVKKDCQGRGAGKYILNDAIAYLSSRRIRSVFLSYAKTNNQSREFWTRNGFEVTGDVDEYEDGLELVAMEREL